MLAGEIEGEVSWVRRVVGLEEGDRCGITEVASRYLGGPERIRTLNGRHFRGDAFLAPIGGVPIIFVRPNVSVERRNFGIAHELSEHRLDELRYQEADREVVANLMAAAHLAPRRALRDAVAGGASIAAIAREFQMSETCAALRLGEGLGRPLAVVTSRSVRVRGEPWGWPSEREIRALGDIAMPQLHRVEIGDARGRFVLLVVTDRDQDHT